MPINTDRPTDIFIPNNVTPDGFRFLASIMLDALKEYDCSTKRSSMPYGYGIQHTPKGDYIQILPDDPASCVYACHLKAICQAAPKDQVIDAVYETDGLVLSYDNTRFILKWQTSPHGSFITHLVTGDRPEATPAPTPDAWLKRACSTGGNNHNPNLLHVHVWGNIASDGFRLHIDPRLEPSIPPFPRDISSIVDPCRKYQNIATLEVKPLVKAIKQAKAIYKNAVRLSFNGRLDVIAKSEEFGDTSISIENGYNYSGTDACIGINPSFLLDALSGFDSEVMICLGSNPETMPLYLTDGVREAVIMPLALE